MNNKIDQKEPAKPFPVKQGFNSDPHNNRGGKSTGKKSASISTGKAVAKKSANIAKFKGGSGGDR